MLKANVKAEEEAITLYKDIIKQAAAEGDETTRLLFEEILAQEEEPGLAPLLSYLRSIPHVQTAVRPRLSGDESDVELVVTTRADVVVADVDGLIRLVNHGGGWLHLAPPSLERLPDIFGAQPVAVEPSTELRVLFKERDHLMAARLPSAVYLHGCCQVLEPTRDDTETVLYADWCYEHKPVFARLQRRRPLHRHSIRLKPPLLRPRKPS